MAQHKHGDCHSASHNCGGGSMMEELYVHFPYAVFSLAFSIAGVALLNYFSFGADSSIIKAGSHTLFHTFHFMHVVFAATGAMLTYFRYSKNLVKGIIVGSVSTIFFCVLSDALLPYVGGRLLGVPMDLHICFIQDLGNVLPFLIVGMLNGWVLAQQKEQDQSSYSLWSHFAHIFVSSVASLLYMVSYGFADWHNHMGSIFIMLLGAVVIPCTMSDVVIPLFFAKEGRSRK